MSQSKAAEGRGSDSPCHRRFRLHPSVRGGRKLGFPTFRPCVASTIESAAICWPLAEISPAEALAGLKGECSMLQKSLRFAVYVASLSPGDHGGGNLAADFGDGLKNPQGVTASDDGRIFVSTAGELGKDGDGAIVVVQNGTATTFASGLDDPKGIVAHRDSLFVVDKNRVWKIDAAGKPTVLAAADTFPVASAQPERRLPWNSKRGRCSSATRATATARGPPSIASVPAAATSIGSSTGKAGPTSAARAACCSTGRRSCSWPIRNGTALSRVKIADGSIETIKTDFRGIDGLTWDAYGRLFLCDGATGRRRVGHSASRGRARPVARHRAGEGGSASTRQAINSLIVTANGVKSSKIVMPGAEVEESPAAARGGDRLSQNRVGQLEPGDARREGRTIAGRSCSHMPATAATASFWRRSTA